MPDQPEILYEGLCNDAGQPGLRIKRNPKNRFVICSLYYWADPAKRKPEWTQTVKAGMTASQFEKEYEISYLAQFGERTFPEIIEKRDQIVIPEREFDGVMWGGFDYGQRNPSSFHVYTYEAGVFYAIWELYKPCKSVPEFAAELKNCPYYHRLKYIAADPSLFSANRTLNAAGASDSINNIFVKEGVHKFIKGSQDETTWLATIRKHWEQDDPTFKICANCPHMIREFERCTFEDYSSEKLKQTQNIKETLVDKDNHALDDNKYFFNSQPSVKSGYTKKTKLDLANKWYAWDGQPKRGERGVSRQVEPGSYQMDGHRPRKNELVW